MAKNVGKLFEWEFIESIQEWICLIRLQDAWWWSNATNTRFTIKNPCDFIMHNGKTLFLLELKTTKWASLPFSNIKWNQLYSLKKYDTYNNVEAYFLINYREKEETYLVRPDQIECVMKNRRSLPIDFCRENCIRIPQTKKRVRYLYDLSILYNEVIDKKTKGR